MGMRGSWKPAALAAAYIVLMGFGFTASREAAAHPCLQVTHNGTTVGTCEEHEPATHSCQTKGEDGTEVVVCIDTTP